MIECAKNRKIEMTPNQARYFSGSFMFIACLMFGLMTGCTVVGPNAIRTGRDAYNEAITQTNNQQMLKIILGNATESQVVCLL